METSTRSPFYIRASLLLVGLIAFFYILYIGRSIIIPLAFSFIFSILLDPVVSFLHRRKVNRVLAIVISMVAATVLIGGLCWFVGWQIVRFQETFPAFREKFSVFIEDAILWFSQTFSVEEQQVRTYLEDMKGDGLHQGPAMVGQMLGAVFNGIMVAFLLPVYVFIILYYKPLFLEFISRLFAKEKHALVQEVLVESKVLTQKYLVGLIIEFVIVAVMNAVGLLALGIQYAILLGIIGALMNLIPYIGLIIGMALPMLVAFATKSPIYVLWVFLLYNGIQLIDNNLIVPKVVASKVKINALFSIIVVLIGGALWGVAGMFLSLPLTAVVKVVFDRIEALKPLGFLLGDTMPPLGKVFFRTRRKDPPGNG